MDKTVTILLPMNSIINLNNAKYKEKIIIFNPSIEDGGVEKNLYILSNYLISKFKNIEIISANPEKKISLIITLFLPFQEIVFGTKRGFISILYAF